jgi:hypothetical protein
MGILDVDLYLSSGLRVSIEIQVEIIRGLWKRIAFATVKMLAGQLKRGEEHQRIEPAVSIVICGGVLLPEEPGYYNTYSIRNARSGRECVDLLQINMLEPSKLPKEPDGEALFNWGRFFKAKTPEELARRQRRGGADAGGEAAAISPVKFVPIEFGFTLFTYFPNTHIGPVMRNNHPKQAGAQSFTPVCWRRFMQTTL